MLCRIECEDSVATEIEAPPDRSRWEQSKEGLQSPRPPDIVLKLEHVDVVHPVYCSVY